MLDRCVFIPLQLVFWNKQASLLERWKIGSTAERQ
jgi:hypothetical protein